MADTDDEKYVSDLHFNALLMLSFWGQVNELSSEDKKHYHSMLSREEASAASAFLLSVMMATYAAETGRTREELVTHIRSLLLEMSSSEE